MSKGSIVRVPLTRIGNSRGIRIPKPIIEQCDLGEQVELRVTEQGLTISPHRPPRSGWKAAFSRERSSDDEVLLQELPANAFDRQEWKW